MSEPTPVSPDRDDLLYLLDGSGFIFRAYYGLRAPMTAPDGTPTNAVFGFMRLLLNVIRDRRPSHIAVAFDPRGPTFRNEIYAEYKANRSATPEDLVPQMPLCRDAVTALGLPAVEVEGYEADDVIGTLARRWAASGRPCVIVTADKDLMQLVDERITLWDGKEKETNRDGVIEKFGVPPDRVIDVLGLAGDASDNIPGVPGIGPKTAAQLLDRHGNLEALLAVAPTIKGKRGASLVEFAEQARLSARLATIDCEVPIEIDEAMYARTEPESAALQAFFEKLGFLSLIREFGLDAPPAVAVDRTGYRTILTRAQLDEVVAAIRTAGRLSFDLETTGLDTRTAEIVGFALAWAPGEAAYVPVAHVYEGAPTQLGRDEVVEVLRPLLEDPAFCKLGHHVKYEWQVLFRSVGVTFCGVRCDSMLAAFLADPSRRGFRLDDLARDLLQHTMIAFSEVTDRDAQFGRVPVEQATAYAAEDADVTLRVCDILEPELDEMELARVNREIDLPLSDVLARMELVGIKLDPTLLEAQSLRLADRIAEIAGEVHTIAGRDFNIGSPTQLRTILFDELGLTPVKKTKSGYSTDQGVLEKLAKRHPLPERVLAWRSLSKLKSTYLDTLPAMIHPVTGRLHTSFRQTRAQTGRISSNDPNLQNIPVRTEEGRAIRRAFVAEPGWKLISADYSQIELRLLAHLSGDPVLIDSFAHDEDVHTRTAAEMFGLDPRDVTPDHRRQAKAINYGLMYGMGAFRLSNELDIPQRQAKEIIERYFARYQAVRTYIDQTIERARIDGYVSTLSGRRRPVPDIRSRNHAARQGAERIAINTPVQGTAADLLKVAMIQVDRRLTDDRRAARLLLTVHDELVLEAPVAEVDPVSAMLREEMERAHALLVPLRVDVGIGDNWAEIH